MNRVPEFPDLFDQHRSRRIRVTKTRMIPLSILIPLLLVPASVSGQDKEAGREIVQGLLRALVESQLERGSPQSGLRPEPGRPGLGRPVPGRPGPGRPLPEQPVLRQPTPEMVQLRPIMDTFVQESATLVAVLNTDSRRSFEVRSGLADALRLQAAATALRQRMDTERDHRQIAPGVRQLSSEWQSLAHQLAQSRGVSVPARQCVERMSRINGQSCQILGILEQYDSRELVRAADVLGADFRTLADEISYAVAASGERSRVVSQLRRIQDRAQVFAGLAAEGVQYRTLLTEYQALHQSWQQVRPEVSQFTSGTIHRSVGRIQETHRTIHQLLRLEFGPDEALLQQTLQYVQRDLTELFRAITLEQMMSLRDHRAIAASADALTGSTENLIDVLTRHEDDAAVGEAWYFLDESWRLFTYYLEPLRVPDTRRRIEVLNQSLEALRSMIGVTVAFDQKVVSQQAASLSSLAESLQSTVRRWQSQPGNRDRGMIRDTEVLVARCGDLETLSGSIRNRAAAQGKCDEIIVLWQPLRLRLMACESEERESLERLSDSFTPELVRMRMMLDE